MSFVVYIVIGCWLQFCEDDICSLHSLTARILMFYSFYCLYFCALARSFVSALSVVVGVVVILVLTRVSLSAHPIILADR